MKIFDLGSSAVLADYIDDHTGIAVSPSDYLYQVAACRPMGFSWSSAVAQDVMLTQVDATGLGAEHLLADDKSSPNAVDVDEFVAVCTDDVMHWSRSTHAAKTRLAALDRQWNNVGITRKGCRPRV